MIDHDKDGRAYWVDGHPESLAGPLRPAARTGGPSARTRRAPRAGTTQPAHGPGMRPAHARVVIIAALLGIGLVIGGPVGIALVIVGSVFAVTSR